MNESWELLIPDVDCLLHLSLGQSFAFTKLKLLIYLANANDVKKKIIDEFNSNL